MKLKLKFKFFEEVNLVSNDDVYIVVRIEINANKEIRYGVLNEAGTIDWFYEYELKKNSKEKIGYNLELIL